MKDKNNITIQIGDIVKIENSPIKSDNAVYVVGQDGTSNGYTGKDLTMYKVAKHKEGYSLSKSSYNICFYPLCNYSNKYHYTREEMNAATIEVLLKGYKETNKDQLSYETSFGTFIFDIQEREYQSPDGIQNTFSLLLSSGQRINCK